MKKGYVEIECQLYDETPKSWIIKQGRKLAYTGDGIGTVTHAIPKKLSELNEDQDRMIIPKWIAKDRGLKWISLESS